MNRANKKEGACLYNKRLTSTLNTLPQETCNSVEGANDRSKFMCFKINRYNLWGSNARSGPSETNVSASEALFMLFLCVFSGRRSLIAK